MATTPDAARFSSFNVSLFRDRSGQLIEDLSTSGDGQAQANAEIIQRVNPDVLLLNEFDFDPEGRAANLFQKNYLSVSQNGAEPVEYPYLYVAPANTGIASGFDLNNDGEVDTTPGDRTYGEDAFGFGTFEGQYGMLLLSKFPIQEAGVRTFQSFRWQDMPGALLPDDPATPEPNDFYSPAEQEAFRLSSKNHWDVPIKVNGEVIHILASHPTPPVFDGPEDRNGRRNFDEIRFWADYITPGQGDYIYDDAGTDGGLESGAKFVIMGDQNADLVDGDKFPGAIQQLLENPLVNSSQTPYSEGGVEQTLLQGEVNLTHGTNPAFDTADFGEPPGNLRVDYVLPSQTLTVEDAGVFWPTTDDPQFPLVGTFDPDLRNGFPSSDHRLVWAEVQSAASQAPQETIQLNPVGTYETGVFDESAAEIVAHDPATQRLYVVNGATSEIDVLDARDPANPTKIFAIELTEYGAGANSVAVQDGIVAVAVEGKEAQAPGTVVFFDPQGSFLKAVPVGALPDMLTFTPDGQKVLVANEGEPNDDYTLDPEGSVSIIDLSQGVEQATVTPVSFSGFNDQQAALQAQGVRIFGPNASVAQDLEPEYITVSQDSATAWLALQENNALAKLDIATGEITEIIPLGLKDHSLAENGLDASDEDSRINIAPAPNLVGMYQPDAIASYQSNGQTYLITANEGDGRDYDGFSEEARVADLELDPTAFPNAAELQAEAALGRLTVTTTDGDRDGDGDIDQIHAFGGRSFSIWDTQGNQVFDSGDQLEQITASVLPEEFNANNDENGSFDSRSDNKGPEPEGVTTGMIGDRTYAFIGLERIGGIMVYDVTDPEKPGFVQYINNRDFDGDAEAGTAGDLGPEGLRFIPAPESPNGKPLLAVANEVSGTTTLYEINPLLDSSGGKNAIAIAPESGETTISNFGGVGTGNNSAEDTLAQVDTLEFTGLGLSPENLLLTQKEKDLVVSFEGMDNPKVRLQDFQLENLDNLSQGIGNILFDGQSEIQDSFDVFNADQQRSQIFNRNTTTFLNDLDNTTQGFNDSNDVINGQGGDDTLEGLSGDDILRGQDGNDTLDGGPGSDKLSGGPGDDHLIADMGDQLFGDEGNDYLDASMGSGSNELLGGAGKDELLAGSNDFLFGGADDDTLDASMGTGENLLFGGEGNDTLYAGIKDQLSGGIGDDWLFAGKGDNILSGDEGMDQFQIVFNGLPETVNTITDFEVGIDVIGIAGLPSVGEFSNLNLSQSQDGTLIRALDTDLALLADIEATALDSSSFTFA